MKFLHHKSGTVIQTGDVGEMSNGDFIPVGKSLVGTVYKRSKDVRPIGRFSDEPAPKTVLKSPAELLAKLKELKTDQRMTYPHADIQINAPLALIQVDVSAKIHSLEWALGLPLSKFPLPKK